MGQACSTQASSTDVADMQKREYQGSSAQKKARNDHDELTRMLDKDDAKQSINTEYSYNHGDTIRGISLTSDVASYTIGTAINSLQLDHAARVTANDSSDFFPTCIKHKVFFYFASTLAYVSRGDGILGEKEKAWIVKLSKAWFVPEDEIEEALKGKDYAIEMVNAAKIATKQMKPNATDEEISARVEPLSYALLMHAIISATQDGFVKQEYEVAKQLANKLGFDDLTVKRMIHVIKLEKQLFNELSSVMKFTKPNAH